MAQYSEEAQAYVNERFPLPSPTEVLGALEEETVSPFDTERIARLSRVREEMLAHSALEAQDAQAEAPAVESQPESVPEIDPTPAG